LAAVNKNFVVKNGIEVGGNLIFGDITNLRVGIGTTIPSQELDVRGGIGATSATISRGFTFNSGVGTALNVSGVGTIATLNSTSLVVTSNKSTWAQVGSGLTFTSGIGTNLSISGVGTIGFATVSQLYVSGISTFNGTVNVGFLTTSNLYISGIATAQDFDALSDERYKTNINTVGNALLKVQQLRGVKFDWKESGLGSYGVVAQELEEVLPELVHGNDPKTVNYNGIIGVLIEAIKELQDEIAELREKIDK